MANIGSLTRRNFLKTTALAASSLTLTPVGQVFAQVPTRYRFCAFEKPLQFLTFEELGDLMVAAGYDGIEAAVRKGGHIMPERVEEELPIFVEALNTRRLEMTILTSDINEVNPRAEKVLRTAAKLGVKRYRMLWFQYNLEKPILPQLDAIRPKLKELAALNRELGLTGLYQNHSGDKMVGAPLWDIYSLIKELDPRHIALAYDIRHATVEGGLAWPINFNLVKSHIGAVCVKDFVWDKNKVKNVPLGEGVVNKTFCDMLKAAEFSGPISIHVEYMEKSKDEKALSEAFKKDLSTLKSWL